MNEQILAEIDLEKQLLSTLILYGDKSITPVSNILTSEDFYRPEHRIIYQAVLFLHEQKKSIDYLMLENELIRRGDLKRITREYLFGLTQLSHTAARAEYHAQIIKEKSILRRLSEAGQEITYEANSARKNVEEILDSAEKKILSISSENHHTSFEDLTALLKRSFERIQYMSNHLGETVGVKSGLIDLDKITNGFQKSDLILLAARPSMGKTALALNIAANASREKTVAVFSLEMSKMQLGNRLLSTTSGVDSQHLNTGNISGEDMAKIVDATNELSINHKLYIDDTAGLGLLELRSKARQLKHEHGLDMVIIDYLQLMQGGRAENRQQEISEISRGLKSLARELNVPIIALSQLSRSVEMRAEKKPQLSDLRESGSLEQDADIVMFLYRDEYYNRDDASNANIAELIIAKNRNGPTTSIHLQFQKEIMRFGDLTRREN